MIERHYNTARSLAFQMRLDPNSSDFDDLVQEGAMAAWVATKDVERTDPVTYGMVVARRRIQSHLAGRVPMLGSEREGGRIHDQHRQTANRTMDPDGLLSERPEARDAYVEVERRIDMERAVGDLEARDHTILQLLGFGYGWDDIAAEVGMTKAGCWNRWRNILRPALRERLAAVA